MSRKGDNTDDSESPHKERATSGVASPICHEGQSERTFLICLFFPIFPDFPPLFPYLGQNFRCQGWHSAPLPPQGATPLRATSTNNGNGLEEQVDDTSTQPRSISSYRGSAATFAGPTVDINVIVPTIQLK